MIELKAPHLLFDAEYPSPWLFLAGSIEMGAAVDWQATVTSALSRAKGTLLNPRRDDWDSTWEQSIGNPQFVQQVEWELSAMFAADEVFMYFAPGTKSPITLLELGLLHDKDGLTVCCPDGFWRKGNVDIVCRRFGIVQVAGIDEYLEMRVA